MGCNYYVRTNPCVHCGRGDDQIHIGKSSAGWVFSLCWDEWSDRQDFPAWEKFLRENADAIYDEYGEKVELDVMLAIITQRKHGRIAGNDEDEWYRANHAVRGPNGLARHQLGDYCKAHGEGTWDMVPGDFS